MKQFKKITALCFTVLLIATYSCKVHAQGKPLNGSGKIITSTYAYHNFDKLLFSDMSGEIEVVVGKPFSITMHADDNFNNQIGVVEKEGVLCFVFEGNKNNRLYIENTNIKILITMPELSVVEQYGNSNCNITGIVGRYLRLQNRGNGNISAIGSVDELDIIKRDNGNIEAGMLEAKNVNVEASGNGNVYINTNNQFEAHASGNGFVKNKGIGRSSANSSATGNSKIQ